MRHQYFTKLNKTVELFLNCSLAVYKFCNPNMGGRGLALGLSQGIRGKL
jgi:hypothetical protein